MYSSQGNKSLFSILNGTILKQLKPVGFDVFFWNERYQKGNNFAERFTHAFECIYKLGYRSIISIGNDTPTLHVSDIVRAADALKSGNKLILGPSKDGGAYLIGLDKDIFDASTFQSLSWQTKSVFKQLRSLSSDALILEIKIDLDDPRSFREFLVNGKDRSYLKKRLRELSASPEYFSWYIDPIYSRQISTKLLSRPPPNFQILT